MHLLHPALVHFAIAFLVAGGLLEAWGILRGRAGAERFGGALVVAGAIALFPTVVAGYLAVNSLSLPAAAAAVAEDHERAGLLILAAFLGLMLWKGWHRGKIPVGSRRVYAVALIVAVALVFYGGFLGGILVYRFGVGTVTTVP